MTSETNPELNAEHWYPIILITEFNFGDYFGRTLPKWERCILFSYRTIWIPTLLRVVFLPLFILSVAPNKFFGSDIWMYVFMFLFSVSNGYCGTLCMMFGPDRVDTRDKEKAGTVMVFCLTLGLTLGVVMGNVINSVFYTHHFP